MKRTTQARMDKKGTDQLKVLWIINSYVWEYLHMVEAISSVITGLYKYISYICIIYYVFSQLHANEAIGCDVAEIFFFRFYSVLCTNYTSLSYALQVDLTWWRLTCIRKCPIMWNCTTGRKVSAYFFILSPMHATSSRMCWTVNTISWTIWIFSLSPLFSDS